MRPARMAASRTRKRRDWVPGVALLLEAAPCGFSSPAWSMLPAALPNASACCNRADKNLSHLGCPADRSAGSRRRRLSWRCSLHGLVALRKELAAVRFSSRWRCCRSRRLLGSSTARSRSSPSHPWAFCCSESGVWICWSSRTFTGHWTFQSCARRDRNVDRARRGDQHDRRGLHRRHVRAPCRVSRRWEQRGGFGALLLLLFMPVDPAHG